MLSFTAALHSAIEAFGRIKSEKVDTRELETIVSNLGINLSNPEFQKALKNTSVDGKYCSCFFCLILTVQIFAGNTVVS